MSKHNSLALVALVLCVSAIGCGDGIYRPTAKGSAEPIKVAVGPRKQTEPAVERSAENKITGTAKWNTGKTPPPEPKALEKDYKYTGQVTRSDPGRPGSITVAINGGGEKTFQTDANTQIYSAGDPRFFPKPMPGPGAAVVVLAFAKDGKEIARMIEVGRGGNNQNN